MLEIAIAALSVAWMFLIVATCVFYFKIDEEQREIRKMSEMIGCTEESIRRISGQFVALKTGKSA